MVYKSMLYDINNIKRDSPSMLTPFFPQLCNYSKSNNIVIYKTIF